PEVRPFPREDTTPPVTNMNFGMERTSTTTYVCGASTIRHNLPPFRSFERSITPGERRAASRSGVPAPQVLLDELSILLLRVDAEVPVRAPPHADPVPVLEDAELLEPLALLEGCRRQPGQAQEGLAAEPVAGA